MCVHIVEPDLYDEEDDKYLSVMEVAPDVLRRNAEKNAASKIAILRRYRTLHSQSVDLLLARSTVGVRLFLQQVRIYILTSIISQTHSYAQTN